MKKRLVSPLAIIPISGNDSDLVGALFPTLKCCNVDAGCVSSDTPLLLSLSMFNDASWLLDRKEPWQLEHNLRPYQCQTRPDLPSDLSVLGLLPWDFRLVFDSSLA